MGGAMHSHSHTEYSLAASALLIADRPAPEAEAALAAAGTRLRMRQCFSAPLPFSEHAPFDLILIEAAGVHDNALNDLLDRLLEQQENPEESQVLITLEIDQIDSVSSRLLGGPHMLLCDPTPADRVAAMGMAIAQNSRPRMFHDVRRDSEEDRLQWLHAEVARIAEALSRLSQEGPVPRTARTVRTPDMVYRPPQAEADTPAVSASQIRSIVRARRLRGQFFGQALFADPAWDMLLDLFAAHLERSQVSVSSLCIAAAVPPTTALRWIGTLHDAGLFERQPDPDDRRRAYIGLSSKGVAAMSSYLQATKKAGLHLI